MRQITIMFLCIGIYLFSILFELPVTWLWLKYVALALSLFCFSAWLLSYIPYKKQKSQRHSLYITISLLIMSLYMLLCVDTFCFQASLPIPGMIRYAIFNYPVPCSILFVIAGILYAWGSNT